MKERTKKLFTFPLENAALRVSFIYAAFSILWIIFSDKILLVFIKDVELMTNVQMIKGWFFVLVTAAIIFVLLRKEIHKVKKTEDLLWATLESTVDGILVVSNEGKIIASNERFWKMWSISKGNLRDPCDDHELIEHVCKQVEKPKEFKSVIKKLYAGEENSFDKIIFKNGAVFERFTTPLFYDGKKVGRVWNFHDLSEKKRADEEKTKLEERLRQSHKMEALGSLAGGVAHDFNNILSAIFGYIELSNLEINEQEKVVKNLEGISNSAERAKELVEQILTFSRTKEQKLMPVKIQTVIKETLKLLRSTIPSTITIQTNIDKNTPAIMADTTQLHQVIMNMCTNAYHALKEKGGELSVSLSTIELIEENESNSVSLPSGSYIKLSISDNGVGMERAVMERIFDPYYTTKRQEEGTGLGLSVVHGVVKSYNGEISVKSLPGAGTTFEIFFPYTSEVYEEKEREPSLTAVVKGNGRILLVDDDDMIVQVNKEILFALGYQVTSFTSSLEALNYFEKNPDSFDLLLTDMTMPDLTGVELAKRIMEIRSGFPVILCTGFSEFVNKEQAKALGIKKYLMKPIVLRDLAESVRSVLSEDS